MIGPINGRTDEECRGWRERLKKACPEIEWVDPMDRDIRGRENDAKLALKTVDQDLAELESCDAAIANTTLGPGWGSASEMLWHWLAEKPVISIVGQNVSPWVRKWSTELCNNEHAALQKLKEALA